MLSRFGRWALGLYPPAVPADLRLTDVRPGESGSVIATPTVELTLADRELLHGFQVSQHGTRDQIQESILARELLEGR